MKIRLMKKERFEYCDVSSRKSTTDDGTRNVTIFSVPGFLLYFSFDWQFVLFNRFLIFDLFSKVLNLPIIYICKINYLFAISIPEQKSYCPIFCF